MQTDRALHAIRVRTWALSVLGVYILPIAIVYASIFCNGVKTRCELAKKDEASWATPSFAPYARATITLTLRRSLAHAVGEQLIDGDEAARLHEAAVARAAAAESDSESDDAESDVE